MRRSRRSGALLALGALLVAGFVAPGRAEERIQARVIQVREGGVAVIDRGAEAGVRERAVFDIYQPARVVKLPLTDEVAYVPARVTARLVVVETGPSTAVGRLVAPPEGGEPAVREGDLAVSNPLAPAVNVAPHLKAVTAVPARAEFGARVTVRVEAKDEEYDRVYFEWEASGGLLRQSRTTRPENTWLPPAAPGSYEIAVTAVDTAGNRTRGAVRIESAGFTGFSKNVYEARGQRGGQGELFERLQDLAFDRDGTAYLIDWGRERILGMQDGWTQVLKTEELRQDLRLDRAVAQQGWLYAIDLYQTRAVKLRIGPKMLQEKPAVVYGGRGAGNGRFERPLDIAVDSLGRVYVLDGSEERPAVHIFENEGRFAASLGSRGKETGQLERPVALALAHDDTLYVLDDGRKRVLIFKGLRFVGEFAPGATTDSYGDVKVDPLTGRVSVLESSTGRIRTFDAAGRPAGPVFGGLGDWMQQWRSPRRLRYDDKGSLYLLAGEGRVIHRLDPSAARELGRWGGVDLSRTSRIAVGADGRVAMLLARDYRVAVLDEQGWITALFGGEGSAPGKLSEPVDIAVDAEGNVAVLDAAKKQIEVFSPLGAPLRVIGKSGSQPTELYDPVVLGTDAERRHLLVAEDRDRHSVKVFDLQGNLRVVLPGKAELLEDPSGVCMSLGGRVHVARAGGELWYFDLGDQARERADVDRAPRTRKSSLRAAGGSAAWAARCGW
ncbi:MAG: hypothetical protein KatS3mg102_2204 [Planctomycetota bacterium]|nr:MAG: hypothetical protein KatS3mg102_2204 [Planctomycetota bacterium]